ncbi:uncharacterized protein LOC111261856 isoform X1 [Varroa jacobsoni]|uniref:uncharacterized protein LOC111261856 isoform X1 n=1 Tax=Varroa jacobsoni TaxID=62625 RepID=UPI000BFA8B14|nr:uncharacterized protein LOC111261856 isoform X1 [Varroa jacobsoni]
MLSDNTVSRLVILSILFLILWPYSTLGAHLCSDYSGQSFTPLSFLVGTCSVKEKLVPYLDLLTDNFLTANNSKEVYPILEEYRHRIQVLASGSFCSDLQKGIGYNRWEELNSAKFTPDDFFNQLLCYRTLIRLFVEVDSSPQELHAVSTKSMAALRWIVDQSGRLQTAIYHEYRAMREGHSEP